MNVKEHNKVVLLKAANVLSPHKWSVSEGATYLEARIECYGETLCVTVYNNGDLRVVDSTKTNGEIMDFDTVAKMGVILRDFIVS